MLWFNLVEADNGTCICMVYCSVYYIIEVVATDVVN